MYLEKLKLDGRVAVVTGAGQGIGAACARALGEAGAMVVVADMSADRADEGDRRAAAASASRRRPSTLDVTKSEGRRRGRRPRARASTAASTSWSTMPASRKSDVRAEDTSDEHWRFHMDVNLDGVFWCCRAFGRHMLAQGSGSIVNIGSMSGFIVNKPQPQSFYNASKAAVHHLTKSLAAEWGARGVRVNAVAPTYIETPLTAFGINESPEMYKTWLEMTPMARVGQPEEIASVVLFLASDAASLLTGSIVLADGGYTCW